MAKDKKNAVFTVLPAVSCMIFNYLFLTERGVVVLPMDGWLLWRTITLLPLSIPSPVFLLLLCPHLCKLIHTQIFRRWSMISLKLCYQLIRTWLLIVIKVAAIYSIFSLVALIKSDDAAWTYISKEQLRLASDVIYYESQFHVIDEWCGLTKIKSFSGIDHSIELEAIIKPDLTLPTIQSSYLVESSTGELLNVVRYLEQKDEIDQYVTWYFKVYKLSHSSEQPHPTWVEIESIGGDALFLGDNYSSLYWHPSSLVVGPIQFTSQMTLSRLSILSLLGLETWVSLT